MAKEIESGGVLGDEVAYNYAHGAIAKEFAGGIIVGGDDRESVARGEMVAAGLEEGYDGN